MSMKRSLPPQVPQCFICHKPVDAMSKAKTALDDHCEFTVWCHGKRETIRVPASMVSTSSRIEFGEAFMPLVLPEHVPPEGATFSNRLAPMPPPTRN